MAIYTVQGPNGKIYKLEGPEGATPVQIEQQLKAMLPNEDFTPLPERSLGQAFTDVGAGIVSGAGSIAALPGQLYGAVTGDVDNMSTRAGGAVRDLGESMQSPQLKAKKSALEEQARIAAKEGVLDEFITYAKGTVTDPALLTYLLAEFIPSLAGGFGAGAAARVGSKAIGKAFGKDVGEEAAAQVGTQAARGFGASVEGGGAFEETYREALDLLEKQGVTRPEAEEQALALARKAGAITGVTTGATSYLGGLEKIMGGQKGIGSMLGTGAGELAQGVAEGFTTTVPGNIALQEIDPTIETFRGTGSAAAAEAIGGGIAGGVAGGLSSRGKQKEEPKIPTERKLTPAQQAYMEGVEREKQQKEQQRLDTEEQIRQAQAKEGEKLIAKEERGRQKQEQEQSLEKRKEVQQQERIARQQRKEQAQEAFTDIESAEPKVLRNLVNSVEQGTDLGAMQDPLYKKAKQVVNRLDKEQREFEKQEQERAKRSAFASDEPQQLEMRFGEKDELRDRAVLEEQDRVKVKANPTDLDALETPQRAPQKKQEKFITPDELNKLGLQSKKLTELDLTTPEGATEASRIIDKIQSRPDLDKKVATSLRKLVQKYPELNQTTIDLQSGATNIRPTVPAPKLVQELMPQGRAKLESKDVIQMADIVKTLEPEFTSVPEKQAQARMSRVFGGENQKAIQKALVGKTPAQLREAGITALPEKLAYKEIIFETLTGKKAEKPAKKTEKLVEKPAKKTEKLVEKPAKKTEKLVEKPTKKAGAKRKKAKDLYRTNTAPEETGFDPDLTEKMADSWRKAKGAPTIKVVKSQADVPSTTMEQMIQEDATDAKGFFNVEENTVYVIPENNRDARDMAVTLTHEIVGHYGLRAVLGNQYSKIMAAAGKNQVVQNQLGEREATERNVEEAIAEIAELAVDDRLPGPVKSIFNRIKDAANKFLRSVGVKTALTDNELYQMLADSARFIMTGEGRAEGKAPEPSGSELLARKKKAQPTEQAAKDLEEIEEITGRREAIRTQKENTAIVAAKQVMDQGIGDTFRGSFVDKFDVLAKTNESIYTEENKTNLFGERNPMGLLRQAENAPRMMQAVIEDGGMRYDEAMRLYVAEELDTNPQQIYDEINKLAAANNITPKEAEAIGHTALAGRRMKGFKEHNAEIESLITKVKTKQEREKLEDRLIDLADNVDDWIVKSDELFKQYPEELNKISDIMYNTRENLLDNAVDAGVFTYEQGQDWKSALDYIPFTRVGQNEQMQVAISKGLAHLTKLPRIRGSKTLEINNVFDNYFNMLGWLTSQTMRNKAAQLQLTDMVRLGAAREIASEDASDTGYVVKSRRDGENVFYEVASPLAVKAFAASPYTQAGFSAMFRGATRLLRASVTTMPTFGLSQVVQDSVRAAIYSGTEAPFKVMADTLVNFPTFMLYKAMGKKHPLVKELEKFGVVGAVDYNVIDPAREARLKAGLEKLPTWERAVRILDTVALTSDISGRAAVYKQLQKEFGDTGRAAEAARELINFQRRGSSQVVTAMIDMVPFFNATVQGLDLIYRSAKGIDAPSGLEQAKARKKFMNRMLSATAIGMAYALMMQDNEEYQDAEDYIKDRAWLLPGGIRIPMPAELGFAFKVIPERIVRYTKRYGTLEEQSILQAMTDITKSGLAAYSIPNATPQIIKPILEQITNYSIMSGRSIVPESMSKLEPFQQIASNTSGLAQDLGEMLNISPMRVDAFIGSVFGIAGNIVLQTYDAALTDRIDRPIYQVWYAKDFNFDPNGTKKISEFYQLREKSDRVKRTYNALNTTSPAKAVEYLQKSNHAKLYQVNGWVQDKLQNLAYARQMQKLYERSSPLPDNLRREYLNQIRDFQQDTVKEVRSMQRWVNQD